MDQLPPQDMSHVEAAASAAAKGMVDSGSALAPSANDIKTAEQQYDHLIKADGPFKYSEAKAASTKLKQMQANENIDVDTATHLAQTGSVIKERAFVATNEGVANMPGLPTNVEQPPVIKETAIPTGKFDVEQLPPARV
jgi:hypothetical protein